MSEVESGTSSSVLLPPPGDSASDSPPVKFAPSPVSLATSAPRKDLKLSMSREQLIIEQKRDQSLSPLFEAVVSENEIGNMSTGDFVKDDVLMRKWTMPQASKRDD